MESETRSITKTKRREKRRNKKAHETIPNIFKIETKRLQRNKPKPNKRSV